MTPVESFLTRYLPRRAVPWAVFICYTAILLSIFVTFYVTDASIPYADQRDTEEWRQ